MIIVYTYYYFLLLRHTREISAALQCAVALWLRATDLYDQRETVFFLEVDFRQTNTQVLLFIDIELLNYLKLIEFYES